MSNNGFRQGKKKNVVKRRLEALERVHSEGIDHFAEDLRNLYANQMELANGFEGLDMNTAVLQAVLLKKGIITQEELDAQRQDLIAHIKAAQAQAAAKQAEETVDPDLVKMKEAAEAAKEAGHPPEAFIFGG